MKGCIEISVRRVGEALGFGLKRLGERLSFDVERLEPILECDAFREGNVLEFSSSREGATLSFRCGLVCTTGQATYLNVEPQCIWLMSDNDFSADVVVYSNVSWTIE